MGNPSWEEIQRYLYSSVNPSRVAGIPEVLPSLHKLDKPHSAHAREGDIECYRGGVPGAR